jgi:hypothetical protein
MTALLVILLLACTGGLVTAVLWNRKLEKQLAELRDFNEAEAKRIYEQSQERLAEAQKLIDHQLEELTREAERTKAHYQAETRKIQEAADALVTKTMRAFEPLRKYEKFQDAEFEAQRRLADAIREATALRTEADALLEKARTVATSERARAQSAAEEIQRQAQAVLIQAHQDAKKLLLEAESRAVQIGGDAFTAAQNKQGLERAITAMRNIVDGYGDRYIVPTRSLLDDLASDFGYTAAGDSLKLARELARGMVERNEAADCEYVEANRRETAIRFVIDAFNGRVDAILSRTKHDNYGKLEQEIKDAFSLVNFHGQAFRNARVLDPYLDARLAELKWAVAAQELRLREREEQRRIQEQIREEEKARKEYEREIRKASEDEEILRQAMEKAQQQLLVAGTEQKERYESQLLELKEKLKQAEERNQRAISMAQQTRRGHVYIISNIGSLGAEVFKIGLTRRLEPLDRIRELGDSSVPFEFDVHALIFSEDAPSLETQLHKHFVLAQVNKVNHRKEFFRIGVKEIRDELNKLGLAAKWTLTAEAAEYRETLAIEEAIRKNPASREAWMKRQFQLEVLDQETEESIKEAVESSQETARF